jgi:midasin
MFANGLIHENLLEIHVDEETDSKSLIGTYMTTDIPGEFVWRPGALTLAVRSGKWVLLEDIDQVPIEIQAALSKLFEERWLPLASGKKEFCHPNFRLFGTLTTMASSSTGSRMSHLAGKRILNPSRWKQVTIEPLTFQELTDIAKALFDDIPPFIVEAGVAVFRALDRSGRLDLITAQPKSIIAKPGSAEGPAFDMGRHPSVRDFFKLLSRISHNVSFERGTAYATEAQRTLCLAESVDVFALGWPRRDDRILFIRSLAAPVWGITAELAIRYVESRGPTLVMGAEYTEIGRARIPCTRQTDKANATTATFARTNQALRYIESIAASISENEPLLLVGETGCGKTTLVQQLAKMADRELIVQNLSLQTDSTDLLGGFRPVNIARIARQVYQDFVDIFVSTFSRNQNADFLTYTTVALEKCQWKKLSLCFQRAAAMGLKKLRGRNQSTQLVSDDSVSLDEWIQFERTAERFERQRIACDSGIAFTFTEGALVEAIRTGKW